MWALCLLLVVMYIFAVFVSQLAADEFRKERGSGGSDLDALLFGMLERYYGSMLLTLYTLYMTITGGIDWGSAAKPLVAISPFAALAFSAYIAFGVLCVLNIV